MIRRIINNLKERTLDEELVTIRAMLEMSGIQVEIDNQLMLPVSHRVSSQRLV